MRLKFHPEARLEFYESAAFYKRVRPSLGITFTNEIESILQQIREVPDRWPIIEADVRRCLARRFPYGVLYTLESDSILILAIMHGSRKPGYWRNRLL